MKLKNCSCSKKYVSAQSQIIHNQLYLEHLQTLKTIKERKQIKKEVIVRYKRLLLSRHKA